MARERRSYWLKEVNLSLALLLIGIIGRRTSAFPLSPTRPLPPIRSQVRPSRRRPVVQSSYADNVEWEPGDVYKDLERLERAIALQNADQDLAHKERLETLAYLAQHRRPLAQDVKRYAILPLVVSFVITVLSKVPLAKQLIRFLHALNDAHFWTLVVSAPLLLYTSKTVRQTKQTMPSELKRLDPLYYRFTTTIDWEDPRSSCQDYVLCLLELWASAVAGFALLRPLIDPYWYCRIQMLTRVGALCSVHNYPKLWFQLMRQQQPRPLSFPVWSLQRLADLQFSPWSLVLGFSRIMSSTSWTTACCSHVGLIAVIGAIGWKPQLILKYKQSFMKRLRWLIVVGGLVVIYQELPTLSRLFYQHTLLQERGRIAVTLIRSATAPLALFFATIGPLIYMDALQRIFVIVKGHDLSLALGTEEFERQIMDSKNVDGRTIFRWRFTWREPERVLSSIQRWSNQFTYWFLFGGSVRDKLGKEFHARHLNELKQIRQTVWEGLKDAPMPDRTKWKQAAMERLERKHKEDYERDQYTDPLGVAVYRTFGVGIGYNYDHEDKLNVGEMPSLRRLQARAAKSAIRRAQEIYDASLVQEELSAISDPIERNQRAKEARERADAEIRHLAKRLVELIPPDLRFPGDTPAEFRSQVSNDYRKLSGNEIVLNRSSAVQRLMNEHDRVSGIDDTDFIEAWLRRRAGIEDDDQRGVETALA